MTPVSRAYAPVAALTALLGLACATPAPPAASPQANSGTRPHLEREQTRGRVTMVEPEPSRPKYLARSWTRFPTTSVSGVDEALDSKHPAGSAAASEDGEI